MGSQPHTTWASLLLPPNHNQPCPTNQPSTSPPPRLSRRPRPWKRTTCPPRRTSKRKRPASKRTAILGQGRGWGTAPPSACLAEECRAIRLYVCLNKANPCSKRKKKKKNPCSKKKKKKKKKKKS